MRVAITSYGKDLASKMDKSFGRAKWFIIVDTEMGSFEVHSNEQNVSAPQGAGIQAAQNVANLGVEVLLTGNVGPNAFRTLSAAAIRICVIKGDVTVGQALDEWEDGNLPEATEATIEGHWA